MEAITILIFWCIVVWAAFQPRHLLIYVVFAAMPFGSFAVIPTSVTAGLTFTPAPVIALLLIAKELGTTSGMRFFFSSGLRFSRALVLLLFWLVAGVTTVFMPRFFANSVVVVPIRSGKFMETAMLVPTTQNVSQFFYISVSVLAVFAFARNLEAPNMRRHVILALCFGAAITVLTGILDFTAQYLPMDSFLSVFRTASYALLVTDEILGGKRVVGLMPEASAFGNLSLTFLSSLYFFRRAIPSEFLRIYIVPALIISLLALVWLSTSSAAYLGLGILCVVAVAEWILRAFDRGRNPYKNRGLLSEFYIGSFVLVGTIGLFIASPRLFIPIQEMLDVLIFKKSSSSSFEERSMWTRVSWEALLATGGLGVGLGGTRASNFAVALFSNAGFFGGILYSLFLFRCLVIYSVPKNDFEGRAFLSAVRWSFLPPFVAGLTVGTTPDFGVFNAYLFGFSLALTYKQHTRRRDGVFTSANTRTAQKRLTV